MGCTNSIPVVTSNVVNPIIVKESKEEVKESKEEVKTSEFDEIASYLVESKAYHNQKADPNHFIALVDEVYDGDTITIIYFPPNLDRNKLNIIKHTPDLNISEFSFKQSMRLEGIDAYEMKPRLDAENRDQIIAKAKEGKMLLQSLILDKVVKIVLAVNMIKTKVNAKAKTKTKTKKMSNVRLKKEKFGRVLGTVFLEDGTNINLKMLESGLAVAYDGGKKTLDGN